MNYVKPEIAVLGDATRVILKKSGGSEFPGQLTQKIVVDCELDS